MSARAPFVPQRPASRTAEPKAATAPAKSPPADGHEHFRPNGLLDPPTGPVGDSRAHSEHLLTASNNQDPTSAQVFAAKFRPLNVSGLGKKKGDTTSSGKSRQSVDNSTPGAKPFSPAQQARLGNPRPSSPFFQSSGAPSMNVFKAPAAPAQTSGQNDEFSANKAHIATSAKPPPFDTHLEMQDKPMSAPPSEQFRFSHGLDASYHSLRSRTASQPSLASIHEVAEEEEHASPRKMPSANGYGEYTSYADDSGFSDGDDGPYQQGLRRSAKRLDRTDEDEDEFEYGTGAKRYKTAPQVRSSPLCMSSRLYARRMTSPARITVVAPLLATRAPTSTVLSRPRTVRLCSRLHHTSSPSPQRAWSTSLKAARRCIVSLARTSISSSRGTLTRTSKRGRSGRTARSRSGRRALTVCACTFTSRHFT